MQYTDRVGAFTRLVKEHQVWLRAFALSLVLNHADADDVFQVAVLTIWEKFDEFEAGTSFVAWAGRIIYLKAQQQRRRRGRDKLKFGDAYIDAIANVTINQEFELEASERETALGECVAKLNPEHREMLRVHYAQKVSTDRMGVMFKRSGAAVRNAMKRIRGSLHKCIVEWIDQRDLKWQTIQKSRMDMTSRKRRRRP